jgi:hypothetical protein
MNLKKRKTYQSLLGMIFLEGAARCLWLAANGLQKQK